MRTSTFFISLLLLAKAVIAVEIIEFQGKISVRHGMNDDWQEVALPYDLQENDWLKTGAAATTRLSLNGSRTFLLPEKAVVEASELQEYSTSELVLRLTALEISNMNLRENKALPPAGAFIIHGVSLKANDAVDSTVVTQYLELELNGLHALYKDHLWPGVILKIMKLLKYEKMVNKEMLAYQLLIAYKECRLVRRFQMARTEFLQNYPTSIYWNEVHDALFISQPPAANER